MNSLPNQHDDSIKSFTAHWVKAQPIVSSYVSSVIYDVHHAEDVLHEVAQAAVSDFNRYDPGKPFIAWALGIARHRILHYLRTRSHDHHVFSEKALSQIADAHVTLEPQANERMAALRKCIDALQERGRKVIQLRYLSDLSPQVIAQRMGVTRNTVFILLHRMRQSLAQCIERRLAGDKGGKH